MTAAGRAGRAAPMPVADRAGPDGARCARPASTWRRCARANRSRSSRRSRGTCCASSVTSGDKVAAGATLMQIDPSRQQAAVDQRARHRRGQRRDAGLLARQYARVQRLLAGGAATQAGAGPGPELAAPGRRRTSRRRAAQARRRRSSCTTTRSRRRRPGRSGDIPVRVGDFVTPQTLLTTLDDNKVLEAYVDVPIERAQTAEDGQRGRDHRRRRRRCWRRARSPSSRRAPTADTQRC